MKGTMKRDRPYQTSHTSRIFGRREMKDFSRTLPGRNRTPRRRLLIPVFVVLASILGFLLYPYRSSETGSSVPPPPTPQQPAHAATWTAVSELLVRRIHDLQDAPSCLHIPLDEERAVTLRSSVDTRYQSWVENRLRQSMALAGTAVVMNPDSGRLLALSVFNADPDDPLAFFWKTYPAASIFKVVTAAAAIDRDLLAPDSILEYTGRPHTLFRKQLEQKHSPWSHSVTLAESFARSINPVFGRIGIHHLGANALSDYGSAFLFNQPFPCELPVQTSTLRVPGEAQKIAEVASGFNRTTLLSPVQAAWIASVIAADGSAPPPWFVEAVQSDPFSLLPPLEHQQTPLRVLAVDTTRQMQQLMEATIRYGTCRESFSTRNRYPYLRPLRFGGKTGNINDRELPVKYDWFVGYAVSPDREDSLALSVLMFHGEKLGHRANVLAFDLMRAYYRQRHRAEAKQRGSS